MVRLALWTYSASPSYKETYGRFYQHLPQDKVINLKDIETTLERWNRGTKSYKSAVSVFKKLARVAKKDSIVEILDKLDVTQTEFKELQSATLSDFLEWRDRVLGITVELHPNADLDTRKSWLWAFSIQVVYGLRIHLSLLKLGARITVSARRILIAVAEGAASLSASACPYQDILATAYRRIQLLPAPG